MKRILTALFFSAVSLAQAGEATIQFRVFGLFDPQRVGELKAQASTITDFRIAEVNYETGVVTFAYADDKPPFQHSKPENMERGIRERLQPATRGGFILKPLSTFPRDKWVEVKIGILGLDCRGCSFGAHNAIVEMEGVERVVASFHDGFVTAWIDPSKTNKEALAAMLKKREIKVAEAAGEQGGKGAGEIKQQ